MELTSFRKYFNEWMYKKGVPVSHQYYYHIVDCRNYSTFLETPLTLGMFIPTDLEGNVLEKPTIEQLGEPERPISHYAKEYQKSQERVIFEGFEIHYYEREKQYSLYNENGAIAYKSERTNDKWFFQVSNIEGLTIITTGLKIKPEQAKKIGI